MRRAVACFVTLVLLLSTSAISSPSYAQRSLAAPLCQSGSKAYNEGNYREALRIFQEVVTMQGLTAAEEATLLQSIGECQRSLGQLKEAEASLKKSLVAMDKLPAKQRDYLSVFNSIALVDQSLGRFTEAEAMWKQAEQNGKANSMPMALVYNGLARHYGLWGKNAEEDDYLTRAGKLALKFPDTLAKPYFLLNAGQYLEERGKYAKAEETYKSGIESCTKQRGPNHFYNGFLWTDMAELYRKEGKYKEAEEALQHAKAIFEAQGFSDHPELLQTLIRLAELKRDQGKYVEARKLVESSLQAAQRTFGGDDNQYVAKAKDCLGTIYREDGRYDDAKKLFEESLQNYRNMFGRDTVASAETIRHLGFVQEDLGNYAEAESLLKESERIIETIAGPEHPARSKAAMALGHLYIHQGNYEQAEPLLKKALASTEKALGADNVITASGAHELGDLYSKQSKYADAQPYLEKALSIDEKIYGDKAPQVAADLTALATALGALGQADKASELLKRAADIKNVLPGGKSDELAVPQILVGSNSDRPVRDKWALVVGISNFKDSSINLKYAAKDATDFKNFLVNKGHFRNDHVKLLTDEQATQANILSMLGEGWLHTHVKKDDLVVVYISSHGSTASKDSDGDNYVVAHDTNKNSLIATGIRIQTLSKMIAQQVDSDRVIVILDVCHSGAAIEGQKGLTRTGGVDANAINVGSGRMVMCSSMSNQVSWESKNYDNSVFTRRLIEALQADASGTKMLDAYKRLRVSVESEVLRDRGNLQTPVLVNKAWEGGDISIGIVPTAQKEASN
ncbi:MAG: tetratricopeptide repeat protein [Candidatus Obscuribacterales bacterium]